MDAPQTILPGAQAMNAPPAAPQYDLTAVVVPLLKGVLFREDDAALWAALLKLQIRVRAQQRDLPRLTPDERAMYNTLRDNRLRTGLRLEQERIGFGWVQQSLDNLQKGERC